MKHAASLWRRALALLVPLALVFAVGAAGEEFARVDTPSGPVRGLSNHGISVFKGIPYANPPERFAPPEDVTPWKETLDATGFGPAAVQSKPDGTSEDCLTLNIWTSAAGTGEKLPVYVWIHGGGFALGAGSEPMYDGTRFAQDGVVYVSINYRLNALGFYASGHTLDTYGTTGNWGILDQIKALEWIRENISAFGGDPDRVTVGGESAGAYSTSMLIQSPLAKGLFGRAIMESGSVLGIPGNCQYTRGDLQKCIEMGRMMASTFGAKDDADGLLTLRAASAEVFAEMSPLILDFTAIPSYMMTPVFDGYVLPQDAYGELVKGNVNAVDLLWGFNRDEGSIFIPEGKTRAQYLMLASKMFGYDNAEAVLERFPVDEAHSATARSREILTHGMFSTVMKPYGDVLSGAGNKVYAYCFDYATPENQQIGLGAHHGSEIAYAFGNLPPDASREQEALKDEMHTRFVNFIKTGDPNDGALPSEVYWPAYDAQGQKALVFGREVSAGTLPGREDMAFMAEIMFGEAGRYFKD